MVMMDKFQKLLLQGKKKRRRRKKRKRRGIRFWTMMIKVNRIWEIDCVVVVGGGGDCSGSGHVKGGRI